MKRRDFNSLWPFFLGAGASAPFLRPSHSSAVIKPPRLKKGDLVGLITPGSFAPDHALEKAIKNIKGLGFRVQLAKNIRAKRGYNAGTDQQRLNDLHSMFADPAVKAVWCVRGGYGCTRLLPLLDYELIRKNPKIMIGYSDITALSNVIFQKTGLIGFHGPVGSSEIADFSASHFRALLMEGRTDHLIRLQNHPNKSSDEDFSPLTILHGVARGILAGGNLSILASLAGTGFELDPVNKLLFLEDISEKPYRIDRMLTQLRQSGLLKKVNGLALGIFADCKADPGDETLKLKETLADRLKPLSKPTQYGYPFGHIKHQCILPVGVQAELNTRQQTLRILESAVS
jgi:muramoyltetrapeptide carboxypeptidase